MTLEKGGSGASVETSRNIYRGLAEKAVHSMFVWYSINDEIKVVLEYN